VSAFKKNNGMGPVVGARKDDTYYWQLWHHNWDDHEIALFRNCLSLADKNVLEIGCGDGRVSYGLARDLSRILGIDLDRRLIESAEARLAESGLTNINFAIMDAQRLELPDDSFDVVLCPWVLHMVKDRKLTMQEAHRVLKPGGTVAVIGIHTDSDYDKIIAPFVIEPPLIEPERFYEEPIRACFGEKVRVVDRDCFPYFFESIDIAHEAFVYTLKSYCRTVLNSAQESDLHTLLENYLCNGRVRINFYATLYLATK
jgi:ubiquinone/menaquinone biosynthesis C-methylase UbiE